MTDTCQLTKYKTIALKTESLLIHEDRLKDVRHSLEIARQAGDHKAFEAAERDIDGLTNRIEGLKSEIRSALQP